MDFGEVTQIFGNGFFPVIMCVFLCVGGAKLFSYMFKEGKTIVEKIEDKNHEYNDKLCGVIDNNTSAILSIKDGLKDVENRLGDVEEKVDKLYDKEEKRNDRNN